MSLALAETCSSALLAALLGWIPSDRPQGLAECTHMHGVQQRREEGQGTAGLKVGSCIKKNTQPPASCNRLNLSWVPTHLPLPRNRSWLALAGWPSYLPSLSLISLIHLRLCMSVRVHVNTIMGSERTKSDFEWVVDVSSVISGVLIAQAYRLNVLFQHCLAACPRLGAACPL